jgi:hypothetical protein
MRGRVAAVGPSGAVAEGVAARVRVAGLTKSDIAASAMGGSR